MPDDLSYLMQRWVDFSPPVYGQMKIKNLTKKPVYSLFINQSSVQKICCDYVRTVQELKT